MSFLSIISAILFLLYLQAGFFVISKGSKTRINILFFLLSVCFSVWSFAYIFVYSAPTAQSAQLWDTVAALGYCLFPAFMLGFHISICRKFKYGIFSKSIFIVMLVFGFILYLAELSGYWRSSGITQGKYGWHFQHDSSHIFYQLFYIYLGIASIITFSYLLKWRFALKEKHEIYQFNLHFYPLLSFFVLGVIIDLVLPALQIKAMPNMAHITTLPWIAGVTFAMAKYQLMAVSPKNIIADNIIRQLREIVLFVDRNNYIVRSNMFTEKLLCGPSRKIEGREILEFFENKILIAGYLRKATEKGQIGPVVLNLRDDNDNLIETSLFVISIKDKYDDMQGFIIYGHDNNEAINLRKEIIVREQAEKNLRAISDVLEMRVKERTDELTESYKELQIKMTEKMRVEEKIKNDIAEKEVLINEIHSRVKNNMNIIISLIMAYDKENLSPAASRKFKELARRVKCLLLVHNNLYLSINYSDVDFSGFIRTIANELIDFYKRIDKVDVIFDVSDVFLDIDYAIPMGLIVNELISNSLQHGFSEHYLRREKDKLHKLHIKYGYENNNYEISISDNGKGLPVDFDINELTTNGLPLSDILVKDQVNGKMEYFSSSEGTMFRISFLATK